MYETLKCNQCGIPIPDGVCPNCFEVVKITIVNDSLVIDFSSGDEATFRTFKKSKHFRIVGVGHEII